MVHKNLNRPETSLTPFDLLNKNRVYYNIKSQQHGYDMVVDRASAAGIIFANPRIDISDEILRRLGYSN